MCMQCMASAMAAVGTASGTRAYVASRGFSWLTPARLRTLTIVLALAALSVSAILVSGSGQPPAHHSPAPPAAAPSQR
jgi:hypothetical protein